MFSGQFPSDGIPKKSCNPSINPPFAKTSTESLQQEKLGCCTLQCLKKLKASLFYFMPLFSFYTP